MTVNGKQNAFVFYVRMLVYMFAALILRAAALAPAACLFVCSGWQRWLAVLSPVLILFVILPLRYSFAQAMTHEPRRFSFRAAFSFGRYGEKLKQSLIHALHVIKWGVPLAAVGAGAYYCYTQVDALTLFQTINDLGNACAGFLSGITGAAETSNNFMLGIGAAASVIGLGVLILLWGVMRNSASRYLWAAATAAGCEPCREMRRRMRGRRMRQLGVALINAALLIPFLCVMFCTLRNAMSDLSTMLMMAIAAGSMPTVDLVSAAVPAAGALFGLYLPLLPLRRWNTAAFAVRERGIKNEKKAAA